jgi:hypothetical protein
MPAPVKTPAAPNQAKSHAGNNQPANGVCSVVPGNATAKLSQASNAATPGANPITASTANCHSRRATVRR